MPVDNTLPVIPSPYIDRTGQTPLTRFVPLDEAAAMVEIQGVSIPPNLNEFVEACHKSVASKAPRFDQEELIREIGKGRSLWQCGEAIRFHILIKDASRVMTHQLVRARVGVTFSQQCTGDIDSRHSSVVLPSSFWSWSDSAMCDYISQCLQAKSLYRSMIEAYGISIQEARYVLPMGTTSFIYMDICLGALAELYKKRSCTQTQTWEMVVFSRRLRAEIQRVAPWALPMFHGCEEGGKCWWMGTKDTSFANTNLFAPDVKHGKDFYYNVASYRTSESHENSSGVVRDRPESVSLMYDGYEAVSQEEFENLEKSYGLRS